MKRFLLVLLGLILVGCEAQATPIAAIITPTATMLPTNVPLPDFRYAVASNLAPYVANLEATIPFEIYDSNNPLSDYDLVVAYGVYEGWQEAPQSHRVSLAINPNLAPLDDAIRGLVPQMIDVQTIIDGLAIPNVQRSSALPLESASAIRTTLANAGYPDGFQLILATETIPALEMLIGQFSALSLDVRLIEVSEAVVSENQAHMILFLWANESERISWVEQVGEEHIIDLWTIPISYVTAEGVTVEFNEIGLPIPSQ